MLYLGIFRKLWMILKQFPNVKRTRAIAGPIAGELAEIEYTLAELRGEFHFSLDFSAMLADNPATRSTQAVLKYNLMRADPLVNPERLILDVLQTQNTVDPESYLLNLKSPQEEIALMMQGLPVQAHERDEHQRTRCRSRRRMITVSLYPTSLGSMLFRLSRSTRNSNSLTNVAVRTLRSARSLRLPRYS